MWYSLVVSIPANRSAHPGFDSRPGASPQGGLRGGRSYCVYCTNKLIKPNRLRLAVNEKGLQDLGGWVWGKVHEVCE